MRAEVIPKADVPGHAVLRLHEVLVPPGEVALLIERTHGSARYLSETGWQGNEAWLKPLRADRAGDTLDLHVGPRVCDLVAGSNVRITLRGQSGQLVGKTVAAWPAMQTSGAHDPDRRSTEEPVGETGEQPTVVVRPPPPPPPEPEPEPPTQPVAAEVVELRAEPVPPPLPEPPPSPLPTPPSPPPSRCTAVATVLAGLLVLVAAGAGTWVYLLNGKIDDARKAQQQAVAERDACLRSCTAPPPPPSGRVDAASRALEEKLRALDAEIERLRRR